MSDIEELARDYAAIGIDVEDLRQNTAQRAEQSRREPHEADDTVDTDRLAGFDNVDENLSQLFSRGTRRKKPIDDVVYFRRRSVGGLIEQIAQAGCEEKNKRDGRKENVERNSPCEKEDVVFTTVVPDALGVIPQRPADPDMERPLRH